MQKSKPIKVYKVWHDWQENRWHLGEFEATAGVKQVQLLHSHTAFGYRTRFNSDQVCYTRYEALVQALRNARESLEHSLDRVKDCQQRVEDMKALMRSEGFKELSAL